MPQIPYMGHNIDGGISQIANELSLGTWVHLKRIDTNAIISYSVSNSIWIVNLII